MLPTALWRGPFSVQEVENLECYRQSVEYERQQRMAAEAAASAAVAAAEDERQRRIAAEAVAEHKRQRRREAKAEARRLQRQLEVLLLTGGHLVSTHWLAKSGNCMNSACCISGFCCNQAALMITHHM